MTPLFGDYTIPRKEPKSCVKTSATSACDSCPLKDKKKVAPKKCSVDRPIMIIGLYPGYQEENQGIVFKGDSGIYLYEALLKAGFTQEEIENCIYATNILKCRPTGKYGKQLSGDEIEDIVELCGPSVSKQIVKLNPTLIILCGELPVKYFLKRKYVGSVQGQVLIKKVKAEGKEKDFKFLATYNPAHIIRNKTDILDKTRFERDMKTAYEIWKNIPMDRKRDYKLVKTYEELDEILEQMYKAEAVSIDFETYAPGKGYVRDKSSLDPYSEGFKILSASLSWEPDKAWCLLLEHDYNPLKLDIILPKLKAFLESRVPKLGQNIKFDYKIAAVHWGIRVENIVFDAMLASSLIDMRKDVHNLDKLAIDWLGERSYKFEMFRIGNYIPKVEELVERGCKDADFVMRLYPVLTNKLKELGVYGYYMNWRIPAIPALGRAEVRGLPVDRDYATKVCKEYESIVQGLEKQILAIPEVQTISDFNINSNQDLQTLLVDRFNFVLDRKTKTGYSTDEEVIKDLAKRFPKNKFLSLVQEYKTIKKFHGTYLDPLIKEHLKRDNRVHPTFTLHIAITGRLSCTDPNVQNVPARAERAKEIMSCYRAPEGFVLGLADYKNIELRILAQVSGDPIMLEAFRNDEDLHQKTADEMTKKLGRFISRDHAKALNFGICYGETKYGLADSLELYLPNGALDYSLAQTFLDGYLDVYEGVKEYQKTQASFLKQYGYVETLQGRKRWIKLIGDRKKDEGAFRRAVNTPIQGTASDINTMAFWKLVEYYVESGLKSFPISVIHDAIMFEIAEEELEQLRIFNVYVMENLNLPFLTKIQLKVDWSEGKTWADCK